MSQEYDARHILNPHHETLTQFGWLYSHTTMVHRADRSAYLHHTYRFGKTDWSIGVEMTPGFPASASRGGSGRRTVFYANALHRYLVRKTRELRRSK
jgi:hypothetical protein